MFTRSVSWWLVLGVVACSESGDGASNGDGHDGGAVQTLDDEASGDDTADDGTAGDDTADDGMAGDDAPSNDDRADDTPDDDSTDGDGPVLADDDVSTDDDLSSDDDAPANDDDAQDDYAPTHDAQGDDDAPAADDDGTADHDGAASDDDAPGADTPLEDDTAPTDDASDDDSATDDAPWLDGLAAAYPGDVGLGDDPSVIWFEDFEEGSLAAIAARYDQARDNGRWELVSDTPSGSGYALELRAGQGEEAVDLYKQLPDAEEWYVRWYVRYEANVPWHHSGMWFGGYNPSSPWPDPNAGLRPQGDDRFSIAIEPVWEGPRLDTYNYWMGMRSWQQEPIDDDGTAYYGNSVIHQNDFTVDEDEWMCLEVHVRLNTELSGSGGAALDVWKNDQLVASFDQQRPYGYWIRDKFCPTGADGNECTNYPARANVTLDLAFRSTEDLKLNAFWPQNYITDDAQGTLGFDQMVVATEYVGCLR